MGLSITPLFSGSKGNCIHIGSEKANILVDAGYSCTRIETEMNKVNGSLSHIDGILVTHEHTDHIAGLGAVSRKYNIPVYANEPTWEAMGNRVGDISAKNIRFIDQTDFYIKDMCIQPYEISHDAAWPFGYSVTSGGKKISVMTDLGHVTKDILNVVRGSNIVLLESNHDVDMLKCGPYPYYLKRRILSTRGHLSNDAAGETALQLALSGVRGILLGHLSEKNNFYELAYQTVISCLAQNGVVAGKHIAVGIAKREGVTGQYVAR